MRAVLGVKRPLVWFVSSGRDGGTPFTGYCGRGFDSLSFMALLSIFSG
jgi:hypothetical protein